MKIAKKVILVLFSAVLIIMVGFSVWAYTPAKPMQAALDLVKASDIVKIKNLSVLVFPPDQAKPQTGIIFYPGGRVDYRAYAPFAQSLSKEGFLVIIPRMPFNLAVFGFDSAKSIIQEYPDIKHWVIGGHSLGGSMAAQYLFENQDEIDGLLLVASYPASGDDLTIYSGGVTSVSASLDGLATADDIEASKLLLPSSTLFVLIKGGNHAQFGWYGDQAGDNPAIISREEQQAQLLQATLNLLNSIKQ
jgi:pimeloyl-ACP methyl ester carboxylesterase